jgi:hypothetical protein
MPRHSTATKTLAKTPMLSYEDEDKKTVVEVMKWWKMPL